jgi:hypothetical protein
MVGPRTVFSFSSIVALAVVAAACGSGETALNSSPAMSSTVHRTCGRFGPGEPFGQQLTPGFEGETVPPDPRSALICRWEKSSGPIRRSEAILAEGHRLTELVESLNSLRPPTAAEQEAEYACGEIPGFLEYLVGLRYPGPREVQVRVGDSGCGSTAWNIQQRTVFVPTTRLYSGLNRMLLRPDRAERRGWDSNPRDA